jgi:hypothetical protein
MTSDKTTAKSDGGQSKQLEDYCMSDPVLECAHIWIELPERELLNVIVSVLWGLGTENSKTVGAGVVDFFANTCDFTLITITILSSTSHIFPSISVIVSFGAKSSDFFPHGVSS